MEGNKSKVKHSLDKIINKFERNIMNIQNKEIFVVIKFIILYIIFLIS